MTQNLLKRGHSWYVRYVVPRKYRSKFGKNEVVRALQTRDLDVARKLRHSILAEIVDEVERAVFPNRGTSQEAIDQAVSMAEDIAEADDPDLVRDVIMELIKSKESELGVETTKQMWAVAISNEVPVSLAAHRWLESLDGKVTKGTLDGRRKVARQFVEDMGDIPLSSISPKVSAKWLSEHLEPSKRSPKTLVRYLASMNLLWKWSWRREWCSGLSPFEGLSQEVAKSKKTKRSFSESELVLFLETLKRKSNKHPEEVDVAVLLIESAARLNEIAELRVGAARFLEILTAQFR